MKNYEDMSDFEINSEVAKANNWTSKSFVHEIHSGKWNPCQNPADAWPIIDENNITIINDHPSMRLAVNDASGYYNGFSGIIASFDENGFRAAMIVFLKMNEDKL